MGGSRWSRQFSLRHPLDAPDETSSDLQEDRQPEGDSASAWTYEARRMTRMSVESRGGSPTPALAKLIEAMDWRRTMAPREPTRGCNPSANAATAIACAPRPRCATRPCLCRMHGPRQPARPVASASAAQLCQRNGCGFLAAPWLITTLTRAGPGKFIASSRAPRRSFGSSTKKPLPPKASIIRS